MKLCGKCKQWDGNEHDCTDYSSRTAEIRALHAELLEAHLRTPEQRLGQLVKNLLHTSTTAQWNIRDSRWLKLIRAWA